MDDTTTIERLEERLRDAMLSSDIAALDELLGDQIVFTNQNGQRLSKADDLAVHRSGMLDIGRIDMVDKPVIRLLEDSAVVCVTVDLAGSYDSQQFAGTFAYTRLWHRSEGRWRIEAAHCSPVAQS